MSSKCWVRDRMVGSTFSGFGGREDEDDVTGAALRASSAARSTAALLSMCTSSIRYTLTFDVAPMPRLTRSTRSRIASTPLFDAASISTRSLKLPAAIATQFSHVPSGSPSSPRCRQLSALARMRAVVVLPVPRGPEKRYAWPTRPSRTAFRQRGGHVLLPDELVEALRSVLPVQGLKRHRPTLRERSAGAGTKCGRRSDPAASRFGDAMRTVHPLSTRHRRVRIPLPAQTRRPCGTREGPLRAASFRT